MEKVVKIKTLIENHETVDRLLDIQKVSNTIDTIYNISKYKGCRSVFLPRPIVDKYGLDKFGKMQNTLILFYLDNYEELERYRKEINESK